MNKINIGIIFILVGSVYSLFAWDFFYEHTLGWLVEHDYVKPNFLPSEKLPSISRKAAIILYGMVLIMIGLYIIFLSNI